jgi:hypothetical protein
MNRCPNFSVEIGKNVEQKQKEDFSGLTQSIWTRGYSFVQSDTRMSLILAACPFLLRTPPER